MTTKTITASEYATKSEKTQQALLAAGFEIIEDTQEKSETVTQAADVPFDDGTTVDFAETVTETEVDEDESGVWLNVYIMHGTKRLKVGAFKLDSDFHRYLDQEKTKRNTTRDSIVNTIAKHGLGVFNDKATFEVEATIEGESGSGTVVDLFA